MDRRDPVNLRGSRISEMENAEDETGDRALVLPPSSTHPVDTSGDVIVSDVKYRCLGQQTGKIVYLLPRSFVHKYCQLLYILSC